jgi:hypothetical protein
MKNKIRFNLSRGANYMKWQITTSQNEKIYLEPNTNIILKKCILKNYPKIAKKIYLGSNKTVCAWIQFEKFKQIESKFNFKLQNKITFNPKITPNWINSCNENIDNEQFEFIIIKNKCMFVVKENTNVFNIINEKYI